MGVQTRRVGFPVCGAVSWSADTIASFRGGGRNDWWHPKAVHALDFANIRATSEGVDLPLTSCISLRRDSAAYLLDRIGTLRSFVANDLALVQSMGVDLEGAFTNKLRNPRGEGGTLGVIGSGGVLPTNYSLPNAGVSTELVGTGSDNAGAYQDWRLFGTASSSPWRLRFENTTNASASVGQSWGEDFGIKLVTGTPVSVTPEIAVAASATVVSTLSGNTVVPNANVQIAKVTITVSDASATNVRPQFRVNIVSGSTYDFTIRIYSPKLCQIATIEGPELVGNGDFASVTGWTLGGSETISSGVLNVTSSGDTNLALRAAASTLVTGSIYKASFNLTAISGGGSIKSSVGGTSGTAAGTIGIRTDYIVAATSQNVALQRSSGTLTCTIDDFSVKPLTPGPLPAYPILPPLGTPGDSARSADILQPATFTWFGNAGLGSGGTELVAATFSHVVDGVRRSLFEYSDGTSSNLICGSVNASDHVELTIVAGGVVQTVTTLTSSIAATNGAYAFGWSAAGGYVTNGSETQTFGGVTLPSVTQKQIGASVAYPALNDLLRQVQACTLLASADAASWAASA